MAFIVTTPCLITRYVMTVVKTFSVTTISLTTLSKTVKQFLLTRNFAEGRNAVFDVRGFFLIAGKVDFNLRKIK